MSFLRPLTRSTPALRTLHRTTLQRATFSTTPRSLAGSDYGSGGGDPKGNDPQNQGANPSADLEHPGPPPPAAGKGSGGGPTKGGDAESHQSGSGKSVGESDKSGSGKGEPKPRLAASGPPPEAEQSEDVKRHNREVDQRSGKSHQSESGSQIEKDKVSSKKFNGDFTRDGPHATSPSTTLVQTAAHDPE
ncbi:hypothetical protein B0A48_06591 [Cryoendolithus antarcticus]|uniref:Uncharacterized protein n=1 Tax=Cryoendolithus antarcticus TaxID=1507870 RepID=A0A1V8T8X1_9PEZI|nr:hypothetical protein B0A48_06591 [Cryoendolithus antarcticus]